MNKEFDYCIVGSGIGGGMLVSKLVNSGASVLLIEAGNKSHKSSHYLTKGRPFGLRSTTSIQLGGTSNLWHGVLSFLDDIDFRKRYWIKNSGWPITLKDLLPYYKDVSPLFGVKDFDYFFEDKVSEELATELKSMPFNRKVLKNKMFQQPLNILNFKKVIINKLKGKNLTVLENSKVCKLVLEGEIIKSLIVGQGEKLIEVKGKKIIICAGALESPRILMNSGLNNINIGKYLMDHPMGNLCQIKFKRPQKSQIYSARKYRPNIVIKTGLTLDEKLQEKYSMPNHCFYLRPSFSSGVDNKSEKIKLSLLSFKDFKFSFKDVLFVLINLNIALQILVYKLSLNITYKYADLFFVSEQTPDASSNITLSKTKTDKYGYPLAEVNWNVSSKDSQSVEKFYNILKNDGFSDSDFEFTHKFEDLEWDKNFTSAAHHVGTCRMAIDKSEGVVDENLKVFGTNNLYICDGSVFPTGGNVNNGFTIAALASRLSNHLIKNKNG